MAFIVQINGYFKYGEEIALANSLCESLTAT